jgi:gliding motility-associated-like protein
MDKAVLTFILSTVAMCYHHLAQAQPTVTPQVAGSAGGSATLAGGRVVYFTVGEPVVSTALGSSLALTQGFHQPAANEPLSFVLQLSAALCPTATDGAARVDSIRGCIPPYTISWSNGNTGFEAYRLSPGVYTVTVSGGNPPACTTTRTFTIAAGPEALCRLRIFNAFSPNGDGRNDVWEMENIDLPEFQSNRVEVYNRWGQLLWSGKNYNNRDVVWDGLSSTGNRLHDGTYYYVVEVAGSTFTGYVEITR